MKFLLKIKKHQHYLYISILSVAVFFIGNALITPKITSVTEDLVNDVVYSNIKSKENIILFEFNQLLRPVLEAQKIVNTSQKISTDDLIAKLTFNNEQISNKSITRGKIQFIKKKILPQQKGDSNRISDSIIKKNNTFINRKTIAKRIDSETIIRITFDIDLLSFWKYFSENYKGVGGYIVVTNENGICLLHPETKFIGKKLTTFFKDIKIQEILNQKNSDKNNHHLNIKTESEYLGLEVSRYFKKVQTTNNSLILAVSFPVDIFFNESMIDVKKYISWVSLLALTTFMIILTLSRLRLRKEFVEKFKIIKEKELLSISNETYQKENALLQLNQLKKKMNPHFLFNSLNSLHALIHVDQNLSQQFLLKLADVYRYLLDNRESNLITVKEELYFLEQYIFLQKIRFNNSLQLKTIKNTTTSHTKRIPFLALETLVENAIKHNEFTDESPLYISLFIDDDYIIVKNTYRPRKRQLESSHNIGLSYLKNSYQYYNIEAFKTEIVNHQFVCYLPLLPNSEVSLQK